MGLGFNQTSLVCRPALLDHISLLQFCMWYYNTRPGEREAVPQQGAVVPIITCGDSPAPPGQATLPQVVALEDGRVLRRRTRPVMVDWGPKEDYSTIVLLKVIVGMIAFLDKLTLQHQF